MNIWRVVWKEILHRWVNFALAAMSVAVAVGCLIGAMTLMDVHDLRTRQILHVRQAEMQRTSAELEDSIRKAMLRLGFNIVILPEDQKLDDWYSDDYASSYMSQDTVQLLARSRMVTIQHILPCLQEKVKWPEAKRTIILVGTTGEIPGTTVKKAMVQTIAPGKIVLGFELHDSLGLKVGDKVTLMGRPFTVQQCHPMRGNKDDITAWIELSAAQDMLNKKGLINAILALECQCAWADLPRVREEIAKVLPHTQIIERGSEALARAEARRRVGEEVQASLVREEANRAQLRSERERLAAILVPLVMLASGIWVAVLAMTNVRDRRSEIGILRAIGVNSGRILLLFLSRAAIIGLVGGAIGCVAGWICGWRIGVGMEQTYVSGTWRMDYVVLSLVVAPVLSALSCWIPAMLAWRQDPAAILQEG